MERTHLTTASEVINALGGTKATALLTGRLMQHVSNWRATGRLPADTYLIASRALYLAGYEARPSLWGITELPEPPQDASLDPGAS